MAITNEYANVIFNIGQQNGRGPRPMGPRDGMEMPPILAFADRPCGDFLDYGGCNNELANFGDSKMGSKLGDAAKFNGIANIIQSVLGAGGVSNFLNGGWSSILAS